MGKLNLKSRISALASFHFLNEKKKKESPANKEEQKLNETLDCYPRNHNYSIINKNLYPEFKLYERFRLFDRLISKNNESFLDIGSCKGFYVLKSAEKENCRLALGIDLHKPFIETSSNVNNYLKYENVDFKVAQVSDVESDLKKFGGPFETVLLIGTYHYLFWGSGYCPEAYFSHDKILSMLSKICTGQVIFSGRLETKDLPRDARKIALEKSEIEYTYQSFIQCAEKYFDVKKVAYLGKYPLLVMKVK
ncbi:MAG: class I SAM-dependent methyltransferase [bacterium]|nr:class I SAM-dependent methyltransferase [bacterium]